MYDLQCPECGHERPDTFIKLVAHRNEFICKCGHRMQPVWRGHANSVIGDECDVTVKHAICNEDGTPRRYTSKEEMKREAEKRGWTNYVVHQPPPGSDKSKHTQRWI
jgi:hypothetical protein